MWWYSPLLPERSRRGHTLVEIIVTLAVVLIILVGLLTLVTGVQQTWKKTSVDPFAEAASAFETMARHLSEATLENYQDYADATGSFRTDPAAPFVPHHLARRSDLAFVCGPAAGTDGLLAASGRVTSGCAAFYVRPGGYTQTYSHQGLDQLLNASGYFVEFGDDENAPQFLPPSAHSWRWRLKQILPTSESSSSSILSSSAWIKQLTAPGAPTAAMADNVITLIIRPDRAAHDPGTPLATDYRYDSLDAGRPLTQHQLPPRLFLVLVAIDEASATILAQKNGTAPPTLVPTDPQKVDLAVIDQELTAQKIPHRIYQREISLRAAAWSEKATP